MNNKSGYGVLWQDIGLLVFLLSMFCGGIVIFTGGSGLLLENGIMLFLAAVAIVLVTFSKDTAAFVAVCSQLIGYTAYKLFNLYANGTVIMAASYSWLVLPLLAVGSMKLFCLGRYRLETENTILKKQVEELVMVDPLTGLYNLRSFYYDIGRQVSYAKRNKLPLTLMILQLRYGQELQRVLSKANYDMVKQRLVQIVSDAIRLEDRLYSIDKEGGLALVLTCDNEGAKLVRNRIRAMVGEKSAFDKITNTSIKVELQIAFLQYSEDMGNDMISYKKNVEKELQYDV